MQHLSISLSVPFLSDTELGNALFGEEGESEGKISLEIFLELGSALTNQPWEGSVGDF